MSERDIRKLEGTEESISDFADSVSGQTDPYLTDLERANLVIEGYADTIIDQKKKLDSYESERRNRRKSMMIAGGVVATTAALIGAGIGYIIGKDYPTDVTILPEGNTTEKSCAVNPEYCPQDGPGVYPVPKIVGDPMIVSDPKLLNATIERIHGNYPDIFKRAFDPNMDLEYVRTFLDGNFTNGEFASIELGIDKDGRYLLSVMVDFDEGGKRPMPNLPLTELSEDEFKDIETLIEKVWDEVKRPSNPRKRSGAVITRRR